jgi:hypothetical protein
MKEKTTRMELRNMLYRWLEACTEKKDGAWESATALFNNWREWAETNHEFVGSQKRFSESLIVRGYNQHRKNTSRGFQGIMLKKSAVTCGDASVVSPGHTHGCRDHSKHALHNPSLQSFSGSEGFKNREKIVDSAFDFLSFDYERASPVGKEYCAPVPSGTSVNEFNQSGIAVRSFTSLRGQ